jgi:hypothetical protein
MVRGCPLRENGHGRDQREANVAYIALVKAAYQAHILEKGAGIVD